jgi:DNA-binding transcriptional ArsR family regulator
MSNQSAASLDADAVFDALGDPMRRRIAESLRDGPKPVGRIADELPIGRPAVSKHLGVLEGAGIVTHESIGTRNLYALAPGGYAAAQVWLTENWDAALAAFRDAVEAPAEKEKP